MPAAGKELTPMLRHYLEVKAEHPDAILFYRMGDFYEMFFEDAVEAAPLLEVQLTARQKGTESEAPMCGVPHHAVDGYIGKLLEAGRKVAVCDQVEDPSEAQGKRLVKREVTRVVTPGTVSEPALLEGKEDNLLASLVWEEGGPGSEADPGAGAGAFLDVSTGTFFVRRWGSAEEAVDDLELYRPREVLSGERLPGELAAWIERRVPCTSELGERLLDRGRAAELLARQLGTATLRGFGLDDGEPAVLAAAAAVAYARDTQRSELDHVRGLVVRHAGDHAIVDSTTLANLEVFRSLREGGHKGTLLSVLDHTVTPPGGRLLREWLRRPLYDPAAAAERHEAVEALVAEPERRERVRTLSGAIGDPERLLSRAVLGSLAPREAAALRDALATAPALLAEVEGSRSKLLSEIAATDPLPPLAGELAATLEATPAAKLEDGGVIAAGVDPELDEARSLARDTKRHILALEAREREATGIPSLKVGYNRVFGYYVEISKAKQRQGTVPDHYIRKQTLVSAERYVTPEIKELEEKILAAEERQLALEAEHFDRLRRRIARDSLGLLALSRALAALDVLATYAEVAVARRYVRPRLGRAGGAIRIREGRHPVVEAMSRDPFVPNDAELGLAEPAEPDESDASGETAVGGAEIVVLTGPNMGGKSTYLRQVALIVLMAQAGSFVPAEEAVVGMVDRIFTRVGASDDLARGESTFMVEMIETANILHHAGPESLVILDEVGRGTATFDGLSLAWAIVEHLHEVKRAKTLFATHYHELTELASLLPRVANRTLAVKEWNERIVFLRRVVAGSADKSYGLHVARLAGLPETVVERAAEVLANLEEQEYDPRGRPRLARGGPGTEGPDQLPLFAAPEHPVVAALRETDLETLTPLGALNLLADLKGRLARDAARPTGRDR